MLPCGIVCSSSVLCCVLCQDNVITPKEVLSDGSPAELAPGITALWAIPVFQKAAFVSLEYTSVPTS